VTILNDSFLEDLDSTNGLEVNGVLLTRHPHGLNDHEVVDLAGVKIEFYYKKSSDFFAG
jgi:pSer/pThr/pTyr-binding forkhead associated (FHA) protein